MAEQLVLKPQPGPQTAFLSNSADICIYGGAAGGGKTYALLLECLRFKDNPTFKAVIFRRTFPQISGEGGIWNETEQIFPDFNAVANLNKHKWTFPVPGKGRKKKRYPGRRKKKLTGGATISFAHLQHEKDKLSYQGKQIPLICFDELTHFTKTQFFYMISRNRLGTGAYGVNPYIRATCNPDPDSWVKDFISWWLDPDTGYPIPDRSGKLRWFVQDGNKIIWADTKEELLKDYPEEDPLSVSFIPALLSDNPILLEKDPKYISKLKSLPFVERMQLLNGNWNVRATAGTVFKSEWFREIPAYSPDIVSVCRYWDFAGTEKKKGKESNDPDSTSGTLIGRTRRGTYEIIHRVNFKGSSLTVQDTVKRVAKQDYEIFKGKLVIGIEQEPGASGKAMAESYVRLLAGYNVKVFSPTGSKVTRAMPFSAQAEAGNVSIVRGDWNKDYLYELEAFPDGLHDDDVDSSSGAFGEVSLNSGDIKAAEATEEIDYNYEDFE